MTLRHLNARIHLFLFNYEEIGWQVFDAELDAACLYGGVLFLFKPHRRLMKTSKISTFSI